ncbi:MAG: hypothetical protein QXW98_04900 [Candidatus Caldarchaeum sp.]
MELRRETMPNLWRFALEKDFDNTASRWRPDEIIWRAGISPAPYQEEILKALAKEKRVAVWGPHGLGKTAVAAWSVLAFASYWDGRDDWKAVTTASVWRQLTEYLWPEIRRWASLFKATFEVSKLKIDGKTGSAFPVASDVPESIEGAHASHLLYVLDEAKLIPDGIWLAAMSAATTSDSYILALSTPGMTHSYLYRIATDQIKGWWRRHVSLDEAINAGRISREWASRLAEEWGVESTEFKRRVLGLWIEEEESNLLFNSEALYKATQLTTEGKIIALGVDCARGGGDLSAIAIRTSAGIKEVRVFDVRDLMILTGIVAQLIREYNVPAVIDVTGLGAGVFDRLKEQDLEVYPFVAASKPQSEDGIRRWANLRAQAYCAFSKAVNEGKCALPRDDNLLEELHWLKLEVASDGSLKISSKEKLSRSPDRADAAMMAWALELVRGPAFDIF